MKSRENREKTKKTYKKPRLRTIELVAEEVLAIGCKQVTSGTAVGGPPSCTIPTQCFQAGS